MSNKFKVGNIIQYQGTSGYNHERGLKQIITKIDGSQYVTRFLEEDGYYKDIQNSFGIDSIYARNCISVDDYIKNEYNNGIPLIWEDVI